MKLVPTDFIMAECLLMNGVVVVEGVAVKM
jgi:hypothetical protein